MRKGPPAMAHFWKSIFAALALALTASLALAAGTTSYSITSTTFADLGAAPLQIQALGQPVAIVVADSQPSVGTVGNMLLPGPPVIFQPADSSSHVYAAYLGANTTIVASPVYATGGSGGGSLPTGAATVTTSQASITTGAAQSIVAARTGAPGTGRVAATLYNSGTATVYVGASGVTTSTGLPLLAGGALTLNTTAAIYGTAASGTQTIGVAETY